MKTSIEDVYIIFEHSKWQVDGIVARLMNTSIIGGRLVASARLEDTEL
jgi:hypothetical protein